MPDSHDVDQQSRHNRLVVDTDHDTRGVVSDTSEDVDVTPFQRLGHYEIRRRIGSGGMGDVYLGYERDLDRTVAIKVLPTELARHEDFVRRFRAEATAAAQLVHPNIIPIYFIGEDDGRHFFVMQYVEGDSLADVLERTERLPIHQSLAIAEQLLQGLSVAHRQQMVHRDIKPGNILLDHVNRRSVLVDFGLVKSFQGDDGTSLTVTGTVLGSVDYIAPEQAQGKPIDGRTDLYSLGAVLYRMLSGQLPFTAADPTALLFQHVYEVPKRLDEFTGIPKPVADIVAKLLEKQPGDRYQDADAVIGELQLARKVETNDRPTNLIVAPTWSELPELDSSVAKLPGYLARFADRLLPFRRQKAPAWVRRLESTEQQVDGAIAEYERRRIALAEPIAEAEGVIQELDRQKRSWEDAASAAKERAEHAASREDEQRAVEECQKAEGVANELECQAEEQRKHLEVMQLRLSKLNATLEQLRSQRDVLSARLKAARAKLALAGARVPLKTNRRKLIAIAAVAVAGTVGAMAFFFRDADSDETSPTNSGTHGDPSIAFDGNVGNSSRLGVRAPNAFRLVIPSRVTSIAFKAHRKDYRFATTDDRGIATVYNIGKKTGFSMSRALDIRDERELRTLAVSPIERDVAVADDDFAIRIYQDAEQRGRLVGHSDEVLRMSFSRDGSRLFSASADATLRVWDISTESEIDRFSMPDNWDHGAVSWAAGGNHLAFTTRSGSTREAWLYDLRKREPVRVGAFVEADSETSSEPFVSTDGERLFVRNGAITAFDRPNEEQTQFATGIRHMAYSPLTHRLLTSDGSELVTLWDGVTGEMLKRYTEHTGPVTAVAISSDGRIGISAGEDGVMFRWDLPPIDKGLAGTLPTHKHPITHVAFAKNGREIYSSDSDGIFRGADIVTKLVAAGGQQENLLKEEAPISDFVIRRNRAHVVFATAREKGLVNQLAIKPLKRDVTKRFIVRKLIGHRGSITDVAFSSDEQYLVSGGDDGTVRVWHFRSTQQVARLNVGSPVRAIAMKPGHQVVCAIGSDDHMIRYWDADENERQQEFVAHDGAVTSLASSKTTLVSASADFTIRVWDFESSAPRLTMTGHWGTVNRVAVSPDGHIIVSASDDGTARVWNGRTGQEIQQFADHDGRVLAVAISPDGKRVLSGDEFGTVSLWKIKPVQ